MQVLTIVLLMICNGQNPGSSMSGTSHNKCSKMPPPTSMHLCTEVGGGMWCCDVIYYVIAVRARRMVRIFFLPYLGNRSKSDPCSYGLFLLRITYTIISQSIADSSWITLYVLSDIQKTILPCTTWAQVKRNKWINTRFQHSTRFFSGQVSVETFQIWLKSGKNIGHFTWININLIFPGHVNSP